MRRETGVFVAIMVLTILLVGSISYVASNSTDIQSSASSAVPDSAGASAASCVAPPLVQGDVGNFEPNPLSVVGPTSACAVASATSPDSAPLANFKVVLNATKPLNLTIGFTYEGNDTLVLPPSLAGINLTASDGIPSTAAAGPVAIRQGLANATLIAIPSGETTFNFQAEVPRSVAAGTHSLDILILVSPTDTGGLEGGGVSFPVNLTWQT